MIPCNPQVQLLNWESVAKQTAKWVVERAGEYTKLARDPELDFGYQDLIHGFEIEMVLIFGLQIKPFFCPSVRLLQLQECDFQEFLAFILPCGCFLIQGRAKERNRGIMQATHGMQDQRVQRGQRSSLLEPCKQDLGRHFPLRGNQLCVDGK